MSNRTFLASCNGFTTMTANVTVLWDATPCLLLDIYQFLEELSAFVSKLETWLPGD